VASNLEADSIVAYHAALQFFGKAYSTWNRFHYLTNKRARPFSFRGNEFVPVLMSSSLRATTEKAEGIVEARHAGSSVRVTTFERTLVDIFDQPDKCGGWEEIWRSLEMIEFFDVDVVVSHVRSLASSITAARVGFFLEQQRERLMVEDKHLEALQNMAPAQLRYLDGSRKSGKPVRRWNLIIPEKVLHRRWEETTP
jgi:predicted transcriptional regulator of viral defense system